MRQFFLLIPDEVLRRPSLRPWLPSFWRNERRWKGGKGKQGFAIRAKAIESLLSNRCPSRLPRVRLSPVSRANSPRPEETSDRALVQRLRRYVLVGQKQQSLIRIISWFVQLIWTYLFKWSMIDIKLHLIVCIYWYFIHQYIHFIGTQLRAIPFRFPWKWDPDGLTSKVRYNACSGYSLFSAQLRA